MKILLDLPISVNTWNAVKFLLFQVLVSLMFARLWESFIRNRACRIICKGQVAKIFASGVGRLSPAQLMVCNARADGPLPLSSMTSSKLCLLLVNVILLASLLVAEYGSTSKKVFKYREANVTRISKHSGLVQDVLQDKQNLSSLYPLKLTPGDYKYEKNRSLIFVNFRVRDSSSNAFLQPKKAAGLNVSLCGMLSSACRGQSRSGNKSFKVYEIRSVQSLKQELRYTNTISDELLTTDIDEIGWIDSSRKIFTRFRHAKTLVNVVCTVAGTVAGTGDLWDYDTYHPTHCAQEVDNYIYFFTYNRAISHMHNILFDEEPSFKNKTGVFYAIAEIRESSLFGIEARFVPSKEIALVQTRHYYNVVQSVPDNEVLELLPVLKEQNVWAILGMVAGNSAIERVSVQSGVVHAAVTELFIVGLGTLVLMCGLLFASKYIDFCQGSSIFTVPVSDSELLRQIRKIEDSRSNQASGVSKWPELCIKKDIELRPYLAFNGHSSSA